MKEQKKKEKKIGKMKKSKIGRKETQQEKETKINKKDEEMGKSGLKVLLFDSPELYNY